MALCTTPRPTAMARLKVAPWLRGLMGVALALLVGCTAADEQVDVGSGAVVADVGSRSDATEPRPDTGPATDDLGASEREDAGRHDEAIWAQVPGHPGIRIAAYEAASPAGGTDATGPPRIAAGLLPWTGLTHGQASAACARLAGGRLCTHQEWLAACQGPAGRPFPYGGQRQPGWCNDYHAGAGPQPTGDAHRCVTPEGVYDLVGNVAEWIDARSAEGEPQAAAGSGALSALAVSLKLDRCAATETLPAVMVRADLGFRCCRAE